MILEVAFFILITFIVVLVVVFIALRIPQLDIHVQASESEKLQALEKWLELLHKKEKFNGVILLSKQGKVIFSKSYGYDAIEKPNQLTDHSSFNLASASKQFTATGVMLLNDQSKIKYQDKISDYIPELAHYKDVTIQHLIHHTSGLPDYMALAGKNRGKSNFFTVSEMISLYQKHQPKLRFKPGYKFEYSNAGYVLLAEIIERVSGTAFHKFMSAHIFQPLNMNDTRVFNPLCKSNPKGRAYGFKRKYGLFGGEKQPHDLNYFDGVAGDGGIYSSAHDLNIWDKALNNEALISNEKYKAAYIPAQLDDGSLTKYGFGWFINSDNSVEHAGGWRGFTSYIYRNMDNNDLIVILDNSSNTLRVNSIGFRFNSIGLNLKLFMKTL